MIIEKKGNIFKTECQTIVNTVNCLGVMGAGIAFEFRLRHPDMYNKYKILCEQEKIQIGTLWIYSISPEKMILNFPTKYDWKKPSKIEYLEKGLEKFMNTYKTKNIKSIAFPLLGSSHGGISPASSLLIMKKYLTDCDIPIEIWTFDSNESDDLFVNFKFKFQNNHLNFLAKQTSINKTTLLKIEKGLLEDKIKTISGLLTFDGVGEKTVEKIFKYLTSTSSNEQKTLFD